jgi:hypothetical protein
MPRFPGVLETLADAVLAQLMQSETFGYIMYLLGFELGGAKKQIRRLRLK